MHWEPIHDFGDGRIRLGALGETLMETLSRTLTMVVSFVSGFDESTGNGRILSLRAEAATLEMLVARLIDATLDAFDQESPIAGAYADGMVRTECGFVAWARIELGSGPPRTHTAHALIGIPEVREAPGEVEISFFLRPVD
jgi:hypothetical protein